MRKNITFEFWKLTIIDKENNEKIPFKEIFKNLEEKPLKLSESVHRYYCKNQLCYRAVTHINKFNNGITFSFTKYENKDIVGSYLENGEDEFNAIETLKDAMQRDDVAIKEYNRVKIFNNGIVIFQAKSKANSMKHLQEYLKYHCKNDYEFEIVKIYKNELFEEIDNGNIHQMVLQVGFQPEGFSNSFELESHSGAITAELKLKKGKDGFLKSSYLKSVLFAKKLAGFGTLDNGKITGANVTIENRETKKRTIFSLDEYQLKEVKSFQDTTFYDMEPNKFFDEFYNNYKEFLDEYVNRDNRY